MFSKSDKQTVSFLVKSSMLVLLSSFANFGFAQLGPDRASVATSSDYAALPELLGDSADPLVVIDLSVELTQQAESFTGAEEYLAGGSVCPGRSGGRDICYTGSEEYIGYFDPNKCYQYDNSGALNTPQTATSPHAAVNPEFFYPSSLADANHECNGSSEFSGNFMNWSTMTAIDQFRAAMTGGARLVDTAGASAETLLTRAHRYGNWGFVEKEISSAGLSRSSSITGSSQTYTFTTSPGRVTPHNVGYLRVVNNYGNNGNRVRFYDAGGTQLAEYSVVVKVCDPTISLENNCTSYTDGTNTWYKPEGLLIDNANQMKYALFSYLADNSHQRNGGVLRAPAKYIGTLRPSSAGGFETNPAAEVDINGVLVLNPEGVALGSGVNNSGLINYINNFALGPNGYKGYDPVAELYYESLRYLVARDTGGAQLSPTSEYVSPLTNNQKDNFPVYTTWTDPITEACQANYVLYTGDQFAWEDHNLPGVDSSIYDHGFGGGIAGNAIVDGAEGSPHQPSSTGIGINAGTLTDTVGGLEGYTAGYPSLGVARRNRNNNGWWFAGLSYWANTTDIRSDRTGSQYVRTFVVDTQEYQSGGPGTGIANPLWLAAKYGGFNNDDGDNNPNIQTAGTVTASDADWDADGDGEPDTYTLASQPANLVAGLTEVFQAVSERIATGSASAIETTSSQNEGAIYKALYEPKVINGNDSVLWSGMLYSLFIDENGSLYEDTCDSLLAVGSGNCDKAFTSADHRIVLRFDTIAGESVVDRYDSSNTYQGSVPLRQISPIWSAHDELASLTDVTSQRTYTSASSNGRYIFTWIDSNQDGSVTSAEVIDFTASQFPGTTAGTNERYLGLDSTTASLAPDLVNFIRGEEGAVPLWRSRTIDADGDSSAEVLRLGDIIHSSPAVVGRPSENYDIKYGDPTYTDFKNAYKDRRRVVYVGANDGMLHAFNAGFFDQATNGFTTQPTTSVTPTPTAHPLGGELWAYVPHNLLPHLRWLTEPDYPHVYYVDGKPQAFDVNIFSPSAKHPKGWGTILVVGFRLGGGDQTIDINGDTDGDLSDDVTVRSGFVVLDITNPEEAPTLLAEYTHPELGYTTVIPTIYKNRQPNASSGSFETPASNEWFLVFGSGPGGTSGAEKALALSDAVSSQNAKLFAINLSTMTAISPLDTLKSNSFVGGINATDWNRDFTDDVLYFGTVAGTVAAPDGELMRFEPSSSTFTTLMNPSQPFLHKPSTLKDAQNNHWVFAASGRLMVESDRLTINQGTVYGIKEPLETNTASANYGQPTFPSTAISKSSDLEDVTDIRVFLDGSVTDSTTFPPNVNGTTVNTFTELESALSTTGGWYHEFGTAGERAMQALDLFSDFVLVNAFSPTGDACGDAGSSNLYLWDFSTGTASARAYFNSDSSIQNNSADLIVDTVWSESVIINAQFFNESSDQIRIFIETDDEGSDRDDDPDPCDQEGGYTGVVCADATGDPWGRMSWREIFIN